MADTIRLWPYLLAAAVLVVGGEVVVVFWSLSWYWAVAIFIPAFVLISRAGSIQYAQRLEEHFAGRPVLGDEDFGRHYFPPDRSEIATKLRKILANHVGIDISRMNPDDRFIEDLLMEDNDSMATVNFIMEIEKEFGIKIPDSVAEQMTTFEAAVDYVSEVVANRAK